MIPIQTRKTVCECGEELNATSGFGHLNQPTAGDISLCGYCGKLYLFNKDLSRREPTKDEMIFLKSFPEEWAEVERAQAMIKKNI